MDMSSSSMGMGGSCKISMLWNWYTIDACFLTSSWHITTRGGFAASCICVFLMVILLEFLRRLSKEYDEWILRGFTRRLLQIAPDSDTNARGPAAENGTAGTVSSCCNGVNGGVGGGKKGKAGMQVTFRATPLQQLGRAVLHAATFGLAYIIMLFAMYFNGYIIICIFVGAGVGKFLCDWMQKTVTLGGEGEGSDGLGGRAIDEPTVCCG